MRKYSRRELKIIIDRYIEENGQIFEFIIDKFDNIRIYYYNDIPDRKYVKIPDFVYGFDSYPLGLFYETKHLKSIDLGKGVRDLSNMFSFAAIHEIDISSWDVSKVTDMSNMFDNVNDGDKMNKSSV